MAVLIEAPMCHIFEVILMLLLDNFYPSRALSDCGHATTDR